MFRGLGRIDFTSESEERHRLAVQERVRAATFMLRYFGYPKSDSATL